jgi:tRNA (guanine37-N1)-methyltransferase
VLVVSVVLELVEDLAPAEVETYVLFTGAGSSDNLRMYKKAGFQLRPDRAAPPGAVVLTKRAGKRISR